MFTDIEPARQPTYKFAWHVDDGPEPTKLASMAKEYASRVAVDVTDTTVGAVAGAAVGIPFGSTVAVAGCVLVAVLGHVVDDRDQKRRRRRGLERAAERLLRRATVDPTLSSDTT